MTESLRYRLQAWNLKDVGNLLKRWYRVAEWEV